MLRHVREQDRRGARGLHDQSSPAEPTSPKCRSFPALYGPRHQQPFFQPPSTCYTISQCKRSGTDVVWLERRSPTMQKWVRMVDGGRGQYGWGPRSIRSAVPRTGTWGKILHMPRDASPFRGCAVGHGGVIANLVPAGALCTAKTSTSVPRPWCATQTHLSTWDLGGRPV